MSKHQAEMTAEDAAKLGAMLAGKGLTPDQVGKVMREQVEPVLAEAMRRVENGEDVSTLEFGLRSPNPNG